MEKPKDFLWGVGSALGRLPPLIAAFCFPRSAWQEDLPP